MYNEIKDIARKKVLEIKYWYLTSRRNILEKEWFVKNAFLVKEVMVGLFKKKQPVITELKCSEEGCSFTCDDHVTLKKHTEWKHPQQAQSKAK